MTTEQEGRQVAASRGLPPIAGDGATILLLGSLPGRRSLELREYYAHPRNAFWPIMDELFGAGPGLPYAERTAHLTNAGVALWDVLESSVRPGSLDSAIDPASARANDFAAFLAAYPRIRLIGFNGRSAAGLFRRLVVPALAKQLQSVDYLELPSTSPAHAAMRFDQKLAAWSAIRRRPTISRRRT